MFDLAVFWTYPVLVPWISFWFKPSALLNQNPRIKSPRVVFELASAVANFLAKSKIRLSAAHEDSCEEVSSSSTLPFVLC
jgi:hypothetical protein